MNQLLSKTLLLGNTIMKLAIAISLVWIFPLNLDQAIAATGLVPAPNLQSEPTEILTAKETKLPPDVQSTVLEAASRRTSRPVATLKILEAQPQNWSDGCLGLSQPEQLCTQVITPGWQVVVTDGRRNWTYRTDETADVIKLEQAP